MTHVTVLFTPITTVIVAGEKFSDWLPPTPFGIIIWGPDPVEPEDWGVVVVVSGV